MITRVIIRSEKFDFSHEYWDIKIIMNNKFNAYCRIEPVKEYTAEDIKKIRKKTGTSQGFLAKWLGVSVKTVQAWELGTNIPNGPSARLLALLDSGIIQADTFVDSTR